jgi:hypothetical protein
MLTLYTGMYENLTATQKRAVHKLTVHRYVDDIYHLRVHLQQTEDLMLGTSEYESIFAARYKQIQEALAHYDQRTYISAIFLPDRDREWVALASMRVQRGQHNGMIVAQSIGRADSSIPTHTLLQSFQYPQHPNFDPNAVTEAQICEVSRLVTADHELVEQWIHSEITSQAEIQAVLTWAFDELIVNSYQTGKTTGQVAGWIFNVKPKLALVLKLKKGLNLVPLFSGGAEPTSLALSSTPDKFYFQRWHAELYKLIPETIERDGTLAAVQYLADRDVHEWLDCEISLPYLLIHNEELEIAIDKLETDLAQHRSYELTREVVHA